MEKFDFNLIVCLIVQANLVFRRCWTRVAPEVHVSLSGILMFPWPPSERAIRVNGLVAILGWVLVLSKFVITRL